MLQLILVLGLGVIALGLTVAMFVTKNHMLGFACAIFWAIFAGANYLNSQATWDIYYFMFFAGAGMTIFTMYGAFGLRPKDLAGPDADKGAFIDEGGSPKRTDDYGLGEDEDEFNRTWNRGSEAAKRIRDRAERRRELAGLR